ncbi:hypothetical protein PI124_g5425 [Phytophthora idaei]|nr:hypothetical protein PI125_g5481 [Phytophthora idaei]KAG3249926.1 hypothetical protein PI124_g5425 [Phytophthora idaei]
MDLRADLIICIADKASCTLQSLGSSWFQRAPFSSLLSADQVPTYRKLLETFTLCRRLRARASTTTPVAAKPDLRLQ